MEIHLLEDDEKQAALYQELMQRAGHQCRVFGTAKELLQAVRSGLPADVFVVDWMLPDMQGDAVIRAVRRELNCTVPIMVLTLRDNEADIVHALEEGADDFVVKPPKPREFLARLEALARRSAPASLGQRAGEAPGLSAAQAARLEVGGYCFDLLARKVTVGDRQVELTTLEFDLAAFLFSRLGELHSRVALLDAVWGIQSVVDTRTVDTHVSRLRRRLSIDGEHGVRLVPVYGFGYRLEAV